MKLRPKPKEPLSKKEKHTKSGPFTNATPQPKKPTDKLLRCCESIARSEDILILFAEALEKVGLVGETANAQILFLAMISRMLANPVSVVVKGARSGGKNRLVGTVLLFFPKSAYYPMTGMSEKALAYFCEPLKHRILVVTEAAGIKEGGDYFLRSLLSEGHISYQVVAGGKTRTVEIEGPTGLILTTTAVKLYEDDESRLISIQVTEDRAHIRRVLKGIGRSYQKGQADKKKVVPSEWLALVKWIAAQPSRVVIPFGKAVGALMSTADQRLYRDLNALFGLVSAHTLLHRLTRKKDKSGALIATLDDYKAVRKLVHDLIAQGIGAAVTPGVRSAVGAVRKLDTSGKGVSGSDIVRKLGIDKANVSRHVNAAIEQGYLSNLEDRKGRPARYVLGEKLPEDAAVIPTAKAVARYLKAAKAKAAKVKG